jgi:DnaK suppressor protein
MATKAQKKTKPKKRLQSKSKPKLQTKVKPRAKIKPVVKPKKQLKPKPKPQAKLKTKPKPKSLAKAKTKPKSKPQAKLKFKAKAKPAVKPKKQLKTKPKAAPRARPGKAAVKAKPVVKTAPVKSVKAAVQAAFVAQAVKAVTPVVRSEAAVGRDERLRKLLIQKREEIVRESKAEIKKYVAGEKRQLVETVLDDGDLSVVDLAEDISLKQLSTHRETLLKIDQALRKFNEGTYGLCDECGDEISLERLMIMPFAIFCRDCQEDHEIKDKLEKEDGTL